MRIDRPSRQSNGLTSHSFTFLVLRSKPASTSGEMTMATGDEAAASYLLYSTPSSKMKDPTAPGRQPVNEQKRL